MKGPRKDHSQGQSILAPDNNSEVLQKLHHFIQPHTHTHWEVHKRIRSPRERSREMETATETTFRQTFIYRLGEGRKEGRKWEGAGGGDGLRIKVQRYVSSYPPTTPSTSFLRCFPSHTQLSSDEHYIIDMIETRNLTNQIWLRPFLIWSHD